MSEEREERKPHIVAMPVPQLPEQAKGKRSFLGSGSGGKPTCNICGGTKFGAGPGGRRSPTGKWPRCEGCQSLERHRLIRKVWLTVPEGILGKGSALQFSPDLSILSDWFSVFELSIYGGQNSIDMEHIDRADNSYDFIICNHVLEHIPDDRKAFSELIRVLAPEGILQITVPNPYRRPTTIDWGYPKAEDHEHFRVYGADVIDRLREAEPEADVLCVTSNDDVTDTKDYVYLWCKSASMIENLRLWLDIEPGGYL